MTTSTSATAAEQNKISGTTVLTVELHCHKTGSTFIENIVSQPDVLHRIRKIEIEFRGPPDNAAEIDLEATQDGNNDAASSHSSNPDRRANEGAREEVDEVVEDEFQRLCSSLANLLTAIKAHGGSISTFAWTLDSDGEGDRMGTRKPDFWAALCAHAPTLQSLTLQFFTHELHHLPPRDVAFPQLTTLVLDASSAHGDNGTFVDSLLKRSPALQSLDFSWPICDLDSCQIKNISWEYDFARLRELKLAGYDFNPQALIAFLDRCPLVELFYDGVDTELWDENDTGSDDAGADLDVAAVGPEKLRLRPVTLPLVKELKLGESQKVRTTGEWFDPQAARPIRKLCIKTVRAVEFTLEAVVEKLRERPTFELRVLEVDAVVQAWRPGDSVSRPTKALGSLLALLPRLDEMGIGMESSLTSFKDDATGKWVHPPAATGDDLKRILELIPRESQLRVLKVWDTRAKALPQTFWDGLTSLPSELEFLGWEGEEKEWYRLERVGEAVRAVSCADPREGSTGA